MSEKSSEKPIPIPADYGLPEEPKYNDLRILGAILAENCDAMWIVNQLKGPWLGDVFDDLRALGYDTIGFPQLVASGQGEAVALRVLARYAGERLDEEAFSSPWDLLQGTVSPDSDPKILAHLRNLWWSYDFNETFEEYLEGAKPTRKTYPKEE